MYRKRAKNIFTDSLEFKHSRVIKQVKKTPGFSADSSEHLWLVIAFISSTEPCVIDYNVKTRLYLAQHQPGNADLNLAADDRRAERFNHSGGIVSNIEILFGYFLYFGSCIQNPLGSKSSGYEWNTFVRVSLCLESRSWKALEKSSAARYAFNSFLLVLSKRLHRYMIWLIIM